MIHTGAAAADPFLETGLMDLRALCLCLGAIASAFSASELGGGGDPPNEMCAATRCSSTPAHPHSRQ